MALIRLIPRSLQRDPYRILTDPRRPNSEAARLLHGNPADFHGFLRTMRESMFGTQEFRDEFLKRRQMTLVEREPEVLI